MTLQYIDPFKEGIHPLRQELSEEEIQDIIQGILDNQDWMTLEEISAAMDYIFDFITAKKQTVEGVITLQ